MFIQKKKIIFKSIHKKIFKKNYKNIFFRTKHGLKGTTTIQEKS